ncbi:hypothetical protein OH77DRAFT_1570624, partial [Trametes cingulata]
MRIDGSTNAVTHVDEETGGLVLRRLHPRIANYNDLVIFLMKSNMDIKFIGSGEAAKALLYYITDYITKPSLPAHVGLGALSYAIQRTNERFGDDCDVSSCSRTALTASVNRMMSRQEISHQQVMSYLVGGGDVYSSHTYKVLHWGSFDRFFKRSEIDAFDDDGADGHGNDERTGDLEDSFTLKLESGSISSQNQRQDYVYRSKDPAFDSLCLYEFVGRVEKVFTRMPAAPNGEEAMEEGGNGHGTREDPELGDGSNGTSSVNGPEANGRISGRGRPIQPRGEFSSTEHTQYHTHVLRRREKWTVPVILGDRVPRSDRGEEERDAWARMMIILFVPWRETSDVRNPGETWSEAFARHRDKICLEHTTIIGNMNVLSECRDVRDAFRDMRRAEALALMKTGLPTATGNDHTGHGEDNLCQEFELFERTDAHDTYSDVSDMDVSQSALDQRMGARGREMLDFCFASADSRSDPTQVSESVASTADDESQLQQHARIMRELKKDRRPRFSDDAVDHDESRPRKRRKTTHVQESITQNHLEGTNDGADDSAHTTDEVFTAVVETVLQEKQLRDNPEQERAFRIIAEHVRNGDEQLLMYIAGVGGTGKTHVIQAVLRMFELLGR